MMFLSQLNVGESAVVTGIESKENIRRRLQDLGLTDGAGVEYIMKSPLGEPRAYMIRGAVIALRKSETDSICIEKRGTDGDWI